MKRKKALGVAGRPALAALGLAALASCTIRYSLREFDDLARSGGAKTILLDHDLSIYSPYDLATTREYQTLIEEQRDDVFSLFDVGDDVPVIVHLRPNEGMEVDAEIAGDDVRTKGFRVAPQGVLLGMASENVLVIEVSPPKVTESADGRSVAQMLAPSTYRETIRHELTHVATNLIGVRGQDWLREGIAHAVEWLPIEDGHFDVEPVPDILRRGAVYARERPKLEPLLEWRQSIPPADQDSTMRVLAFTLVTFLIEHERPAGVGEALERVARLDDDDIRALQPEWSAWLEGLGPPPR